MKLCRGWIGDFVELPPSDELARRLTAAGMAVEGVEEAGGEVVVDVDVTTNRPDAMCHFGMAREVAAATGAELRLPEAELPPPGAGSPPVVELPASDLCRRYVARVAHGVRVGPSPEWMVRRLEAIGLRAINNVVDATNYVLWELGQPLHAFDLERLGSRVAVRPARAGERLTTLDGMERELSDEMLAITDGERPVALAGVMGGEATEVTAATTSILLESAWFDPAAVRRSARAAGLHTDASHRFERGADPEACLLAADRCLALLAAQGMELTLEPAVDALGAPPPPRAEIAFSPARLAAFAGVEVPADECRRILESLGFEIAASGDGVEPWRVTAPSWRRLDVVEEADVFEEVLRIHGFDRVPAALPALAGADAPQPPAWIWRREARRVLTAAGLAEAIDYAFHSAEEDAAIAPLPGIGAPLGLDNPLSERYRLLRRSLLPPLVASARFNQRRNLPAVRLFEMGHVFWRGDDGEPAEAEHLAIVLGGEVGTPWQRRQALDLFDLTGVVEALGEALGHRLQTRPATRRGLMAGVAAEVLLASSGEVVGQLGQLAEEEPGPYPLFVAELAAAPLHPAPFAEVEVPSRFPGVAVDLTLTHPLTVEWRRLEEEIRRAAVPDLLDFGLKDRYTGPGVPEGAVNTTLTFFYNAGDRSLTREEVTARHEAIAGRLTAAFAGGDDDGR